MAPAERASGGNGHKDALHFSKPPERVISLVPAITESMFELGFGDHLVGITDDCIHPAGEVEKIPRVGRRKTPDLQIILALQPDLIIANWDENTSRAVEALRSAGLAVWVTFPQSVAETIDMLWKLAELIPSQIAKIRLQTLELTLDWAVSAALERQPVRYFCPIGYGRTRFAMQWWMTFNQRTYCHDLLQLLGGENVFAQRERRYPLAADLALSRPNQKTRADTRFPRVSLDEIRLAQPEVILLPSTPYPFAQLDFDRLADLLEDTPAVRNGRVYAIEGAYITWQGTRLALALRELPALLDIHQLG